MAMKKTNPVATYFKGMDWVLITEVLALSLIGFIVVFSATTHNGEISSLWTRQISWFFVSLIVLWVFSKIDYRFWIEASYIFYWIAIVSLLLVLFFSDETN